MFLLEESSLTKLQISKKGVLYYLFYTRHPSHSTSFLLLAQAQVDQSINQEKKHQLTDDLLRRRKEGESEAYRVSISAPWSIPCLLPSSSSQTRSYSITHPRDQQLRYAALRIHVARASHGPGIGFICCAKGLHLWALPSCRPSAPTARGPQPWAAAPWP
jgi:hypothetical protein